MLLYFIVETLSEDEEDRAHARGDGLSISSDANYTAGSDFVPTPGGPFSALTPSMWPQDIMQKLTNPVSKKAFISNGFLYNPL